MYRKEYIRSEDAWHIFKLIPEAEEGEPEWDWVATVVTETVADILLSALESK